MTYKKGDALIIHTPERDKWTPAFSEKVTVTKVFKSGKINVWSEYGYGYSVKVEGFLKYGGRIEAA